MPALLKSLPVDLPPRRALLWHLLPLVFGAVPLFARANAANKLEPLNVPIVVAEASSRPFVRRALDVIGAAARIEWQVQVVPWARALLMAERGEALAFGVSRTRAREQTLAFSEPVFNNHAWMVVRRDQSLDYRSLDDLKGRVLCASRGASFGTEFEAAKGRVFQLEPVDGALSAHVRMLMAGRCDVMLMTHRSARPWLVERRLRELSGYSAALAVLPTPMLVDPVHFAVSREHAWASVLPRLNLAMRQQAMAMQSLIDSDL